MDDIFGGKPISEVVDKIHSQPLSFEKEDFDYSKVNISLKYDNKNLSRRLKFLESGK